MLETDPQLVGWMNCDSPQEIQQRDRTHGLRPHDFTSLGLEANDYGRMSLKIGVAVARRNDGTYSQNTEDYFLKLSIFRWYRIEVHLITRL